jgi:hypothetical protein
VSLTCGEITGAGGGGGGRGGGGGGGGGGGARPTGGGTTAMAGVTVAGAAGAVYQHQSIISLQAQHFINI